MLITHHRTNLTAPFILDPVETFPTTYYLSKRICLVDNTRFEIVFVAILVLEVVNIPNKENNHNNSHQNGIKDIKKDLMRN